MRFSFTIFTLSVGCFVIISIIIYLHITYNISITDRLLCNVNNKEMNAPLTNVFFQC